MFSDEVFSDEVFSDEMFSDEMLLPSSFANGRLFFFLKRCGAG